MKNKIDLMVINDKCKEAILVLTLSMIAFSENKNIMNLMLLLDHFLKMDEQILSPDTISFIDNLNGDTYNKIKEGIFEKVQFNNIEDNDLLNEINNLSDDITKLSDDVAKGIIYISDYYNENQKITENKDKEVVKILFSLYKNYIMEDVDKYAKLSLFIFNIRNEEELEEIKIQMKNNPLSTIAKCLSIIILQIKEQNNIFKFEYKFN